jgi:hypothetical protein
MLMLEKMAVPEKYKDPDRAKNGTNSRPARRTIGTICGQFRDLF